MNHLKDLKQLKNKYFVMRHGESEANVQKIIISYHKNGVQEYGLSNLGKKQAQDSIEKNKILDKHTIIYTSDLKRTIETANIIAKHLKIKVIHKDIRLRERNFGKWETTHNSNYNKIWEDDLNDPNHKIKDVESTKEVLSRTTELILWLEQKYNNKKIVLVAHGDALQILQSGFQKMCSSKHRSFQHLETAEIRELKLER